MLISSSRAAPDLRSSIKYCLNSANFSGASQSLQCSSLVDGAALMEFHFLEVSSCFSTSVSSSSSSNGFRRKAEPPTANALASSCSVSNAVTKTTGTRSMSSRARRWLHTSQPSGPPGIITSSSTRSGRRRSSISSAAFPPSARWTSYSARRKLRSRDDSTEASSSTTSRTGRVPFRMNSPQQVRTTPGPRPARLGPSDAHPFGLLYSSVGRRVAFFKGH